MAKAGTTMEKQILAILRRGSTPLSAYDILGELRDAHPKIAPPTVYRALARLKEAGCVHRLESKNAYVSCRCDAHHGASVLSICNDCGNVEEMLAETVLEALSTVTSQSGFASDHHVIEVHGLCAGCNVNGSQP